MKTKKRTHLVLLIIFIITLAYVTPLVYAEEELGLGNPNTNGQVDSSGNQQQGPTNNSNQMGGPGGNQTQGQNQNGPGKQGNNNENNIDGSQHQYRYQRRFMNIDGEGNCTRIRSQYKNNATEETFEIYFNIDKAPTIQLSYIPKINTTSNLNHFNLIIEQLIEYNDINSNGKYDHNDAIISNIMMSDAKFTNITYTNNTTPDNKIVSILETHTLDNVFSITIYVASEQTSFLNNVITPEEIKIDFNIIDYPFMNQISQLALITKVETPFAITPEQNTYDEEKGTAFQENGLNISSVSHRGFFSWANVATIDNTSYPVNVTVISETEQTFTQDNQETYNQTQVIFSYPRGQSITHDPKIGVIGLIQNILPSVLQVEYLSIMYLLACIISGIVFYGVIRHKKKM